MKEVIPVFFAVNDNYAPYLGVAIKSMLENLNRKYFCKIHVLITSLSEEHTEKLKEVVSAYSRNASIVFVDVAKECKKMAGMFHMRDYYSQETYFRFFISPLFPEYDKVVYLDCDIVVVGDVSELYNQDIGDKMVAAAVEEVVYLDDDLGFYSERCLGVPWKEYFGAGILVINSKLFREERVEEQFVDLLRKYKFTVAQDQDYLNVICLERVHLLNLGWNKTAFVNQDFNDNDLKIVHYKMSWKPWLNDDVTYENYFWKYAESSPFFDEIMEVKRTYTDDERVRDAVAGKKLLETAVHDAEDPDNYLCQMERNGRRLPVSVFSRFTNPRAVEALSE